MKNRIVEIDTRRIVDWDSFHDTFANALGFPGFYGRNLDAWIDCLGYVDSPENGMSEIHVEPGSVLVIQLSEVREFSQRCPEQYAALIECSAFVNHRRIEAGEEPVIALSFSI
ncbi:MAG TPA: barstar family protein [Blastocatellia bacterium]|nr:barstar family protein [Blastocatellia bacterium]HMX29862.1 barstar family protein [Blastocatellia bacterium]HMY73927.1 barstar family protein [Blastocatellia bacterium]HMZ18274.1 barstar family protein [Blastocatellia bacterium]HNG30973.1 barstar family protein [Blastocatellia bacterium]